RPPRRGRAGAGRAGRPQPGQPAADAGGAVPAPLRRRAGRARGGRRRRRPVRRRAGRAVTAVDTRPPAAPATHRPGADRLAGTGRLARLALRTSRVRIGLWVAGVALTVYS